MYSLLENFKNYISRNKQTIKELTEKNKALESELAKTKEELGEVRTELDSTLKDANELAEVLEKEMSGDDAKQPTPSDLEPKSDAKPTTPSDADRRQAAKAKANKTGKPK